MLSNTDILRFYKAGALVIEPFNQERLNTTSYDLLLGDQIARYKPERDPVCLDADDPADMFVLENAAERIPRWKDCPKCGRRPVVEDRSTSILHPTGEVRAHCFDCRGSLEKETTTARGFWLKAGERVLGVTQEMAGGRVVECPECAGGLVLGIERCLTCLGAKEVAFTSQLHATSTAARIGFQAVGCAGFGDCSFFSRWVLEVTNLSPVMQWLPVGAIIVQISFFRITPPLQGSTYDKTGSYQRTADLEEIRQKWTLKDNLPKRLKVR